MMEYDNSSPTWRMQRLFPFALPLGACVLSIVAWGMGLSRSGFWADDFLEVTHYFHSLGDLGNDHINAGRYVDNVFWGLGTYAFGSGSVIPYLVLNTFVFAGGVILWLRTGTKTRWSPLVAWWVGGLFIATAVWFPTALSASAIGHSCGFLGLGLGLLCHERCMRSRTENHSLLWSLACGGAWTFAVISNIIYIGLLPIAAYCGLLQALKLRDFGASPPRAFAAVGAWTLVLPVVYFFAVAYPATTYKPEYASNGLGYVHQNFDFYRESLAPSTALQAVYVAVFLLALLGGVIAARRKDWFPLAILVAAGAVAIPAFVQSHQRFVFYMAMPLLLLFSAVGAGVRPLLQSSRERSREFSGGLLLAAAVVLVLVFGQGANLRSFFVESPYGATLSTFRSHVASLTPEGGSICVRLDVNAQQQALFSAEMSSENGFLVPPINAARAVLVSSGQPCPPQGITSTITVSLDARGNFAASD